MESQDLSAFFYTRKQANDFSARLSDFAEEVYKTDFNLEKVLIDKLGLEKKEKFMILLRDLNVNTSSQSALKDFIAKLQEQISKIPVLSLTLSFEPKEETLKLINDWIMLSLKRQLLLDISINPDLIAGVVINYNGKFKDYSIRTGFDKIVSEVVAGGANNSAPTPQHTTTH